MISSLDGVIKNIDHIKRSDINLISIRDTTPSELYAKLYSVIDQAGLKNLYVATFDDLVAQLPTDYDRSERPPEENDIQGILDWARKQMVENKNDFIVQCSAGVSRSSAVAILVNYLHDPENAIKVINPMIHSPNEKVLEIGEKLLNTKNIKDPTKKILDNYTAQWMENVGAKNTEDKQKNIF